MKKSSRDYRKMMRIKRRVEKNPWQFAELEEMFIADFHERWRKHVEKCHSDPEFWKELARRSEEFYRNTKVEFSASPVKLKVE